MMQSKYVHMFEFAKMLLGLAAGVLFICLYTWFHIVVMEILLGDIKDDLYIRYVRYYTEC